MNLRKSIFYICMVFSLVLFVEGLFTILNFTKEDNKDFASQRRRIMKIEKLIEKL